MQTGDNGTPATPRIGSTSRKSKAMQRNLHADAAKAASDAAAAASGQLSPRQSEALVMAENSKTERCETNRHMPKAGAG